MCMLDVRGCVPHHPIMVNHVPGSPIQAHPSARCLNAGGLKHEPPQHTSITCRTAAPPCRETDKVSGDVTAACRQEEMRVCYEVPQPARTPTGSAIQAVQHMLRCWPCHAHTSEAGVHCLRPRYRSGKIDVGEWSEPCRAQQLDLCRPSWVDAQHRGNSSTHVCATATPASLWVSHTTLRGSLHCETRMDGWHVTVREQHPWQGSGELGIAG